MANRRFTRMEPQRSRPPAESAADRDASPAGAPTRDFQAPPVAQESQAAHTAQTPVQVDRAVRSTHSLGDLQIFDGDRQEDGGASNASATALQREAGRGRPLDDSVRAPLEGAFRTDFSDVVVHTDGQAAALSRSLSARAFTAGSDIYFGDSAYDPGSAGGRELLVHELTHVVQQRSGSGTGTIEVSDPRDGAELEA
ncbi:MAG TPA: DUF4157 domain-containing protein, partial [Chloroflexota bacterium]|nr:DUF4157 domain-containing protein [Chloroflexota bacterium]